jgi:hypothetical protein
MLGTSNSPWWLFGAVTLGTSNSPWWWSGAVTLGTSNSPWWWSGAVMLGTSKSLGVNSQTFKGGTTVAKHIVYATVS